MVQISNPRPVAAGETWIAFSGERCVALGTPHAVGAAVKARVDAEPDALMLVFNARTSFPVELDLRGSLADMLARLPAMSATDPEAEIRPDTGTVLPATRAPGRPKLGVTAREVTLLPRHWDWLAGQSGGASVALRKLVEQAMRTNADADRLRDTRESAYRFMTAIAGNAPSHEEAVRALFAGDIETLRGILAHWPEDIRAHVLRLVQPA